MLYYVIRAGDIDFWNQEKAEFDNFEVDNLSSQFSPINPLIAQSHSFHQEYHNTASFLSNFKHFTQCDVDWVRYIPLCSGTQEIKTYAMNNKLNANTRLTFFAADGTTQLTQNDDISATNTFSSITYNFNAMQDYYIRVDNMGAQATTYYILLIGEMALNQAKITSTSGDAICGSPNLGIDIGATLPSGSTIEWELN